MLDAKAGGTSILYTEVTGVEDYVVRALLHVDIDRMIRIGERVVGGDVGNPGQQIGWMGAYGVRLQEAKENGYWICPKTNERYQASETGLVKIN